MDKDYRDDNDFKEFISKMADGLNDGSKKYGPDGYLDRDVVAMAEEEIRDLACYAFMLHKKLKLIRIKFLKEVKEERRVNNADRT
jgi:hypothetical protein